MPKYLVKGTINYRGKKYEGTAQKPVEVELPSDVFHVTASRYINGEYVRASPENPAQVRLPEGSVIDSGLQPEAPPAPKPAHVPGRIGTAPSGAEHFAKKDKRPSDEQL